MPVNSTDTPRPAGDQRTEEAFAHEPHFEDRAPAPFDRWFVLAQHDGPVTFDVIGRALNDLAETSGWYLDQPGRLYAPTADHRSGHTGVKFTYARTGPDGSTDYLAVAGLDLRPAEIHLNGSPVTWAEVCVLMARDSRPAPAGDGSTSAPDTTIPVNSPTEPRN